jgi:DNA-binding beta-propeller fold protein YncE
MPTLNTRAGRFRWLLVWAVLLLGILPIATAARSGPELWVIGQDTSRIFIMQGETLVETIQLPAGTGPHMARFSPDGQYAYVAAVTAGDLVILDAGTHEVVQRLDLGTSGVHEAAPSPDGSLLVVAQQTTRELILIDADTQSQTWTETGRISLPASPVCTIFLPEENKAYVTLSGQDIAIVDLEAMQVTGTIDINGQSRCNYDWTSNGKQLYLTAENGTDGFLYTIDLATDTPTLLHTFAGARDIHTPVVSANGKEVNIIGRGNDRFYNVSLETLAVSSFEIGTPGVTDQPDGMVINGNTAYINLKATGRLAVLRLNTGTITYVDLVAPSANAALNIIRRPNYQDSLASIHAPAVMTGDGRCVVFSPTILVNVSSRTMRMIA